MVDVFFLVRGNLTDAQWQQRLTFGPLLKNAATYAVIFGGSLLILSILGFEWTAEARMPYNAPT